MYAKYIVDKKITSYGKANFPGMIPRENESGHVFTSYFQILFFFL